MTVNSGVNDGIVHDGNDVATNFSFPFKVNSSSQVEVILRDADGDEEILVTNYTVNNPTVEGSGSVDYPTVGSPLATGYSLAINPKMDYKQSTDLRNQGRFAPETHEAAFDTAMMHIKEVRGLINRTIKFKKSSAIVNAEFSDDPVADTAVVWDGVAGAMKNGPTTTQISSAQGYAEAAEDSADLAEQWATQLTTPVEASSYSAKENAVGDSVTTGSAKNWAMKTSAAVTTGLYSAKEWAQGVLTRGLANGGSAKDWATYIASTVDNAEYSAKYYANAAAVSLDDLQDMYLSLKSFGAVGDGVTDDTAAWQAACAAINNNILTISEGTYLISDYGLVENPGGIFAHKGAVLKLADGTIVNTDGAYGNFTPILRIQGVDGFLIDSINIDGNRDGQTYPATRSTFGRGGTNDKRHNACIEVCSDGTNRSKNITVANSRIYNSYLSGCMFIQCEGVRIHNNYTYNNTWNGFGGGENTDVVAQRNKSYRDGVSTDFPDTQNAGDRGAFQFRELGSTVTTVTDGLPIIAGTLRTNAAITIVDNYIEEACVIGAFVRGCLGVNMSRNTAKNVGYQRASTSYSPSPFWIESCSGIMAENTAIQTTDNSASGWMKPDAFVAYGFDGDGDTEQHIDGLHYMQCVNNNAFCSQDYDGVTNYTTDARKKVNFHRGIRAGSSTKISGNIIEGTDSSFVLAEANQQFSSEWVKRVSIFDNTFYNSTATNPISFSGGAGSPAGNSDNIKVQRNTIFDLRSVATGSEDRIAITFASGFVSVPLLNCNISNNIIDCTNSADAAKPYQFARVRGTEASTVKITGNTAKGASTFVGMSKFKELDISDNTTEGAASNFAIALAANSGRLRVTGNSFLDMTAVIGSVTAGAFTMDTFVFRDNILSGDMTGFLATLTPGICPKMLDTGDNVLRTRAVYAPTSLADGAGVLATFTSRPFYKLGDILQCSFSLDTQGIWFNPYVSVTGTLNIRLENEMAAGTIALASGHVRFIKHRLRPEDLSAAVVYDPTSLVANAGASTTVTVNGAQLGDFALVSFDKNLTNVGLFAYVSAANTVTVLFQNQSGATVDLDSGILRVIVRPKNSILGITGAATYDPGILLDGAGETTTVTVTGAALGDCPLVSFSLDQALVIVHAWVSAANTVSVRFQNESTGVVDLGSGTITCTIDAVADTI